MSKLNPDRCLQARMQVHTPRCCCDNYSHSPQVGLTKNIPFCNITKPLMWLNKKKKLIEITEYEYISIY